MMIVFRNSVVYDLCSDYLYIKYDECFISYFQKVIFR
jgi:hypothetical protein